MIGVIIKNARRKKGLTQKELGKRMSLADTTISSYERGNSQPDFATIIKIMEICGYKLTIIDKISNEIISIDRFSREK